MLRTWQQKATPIISFATTENAPAGGAERALRRRSWAGYLALVNQQSVSHGHATVGFLNPTIYSIGLGSSYGADFHDITSGSNGAYSAPRGYDLVTGWGSPNGVALINALAP